MKNWKKMIAAASVLASLALFAGCTTASAVTLEEARDLVKARLGAENAVVVEQETDREDGVYELDIILDGTRYEFEVDSRTGTVREVDREQTAAPAQTTPPAGTQPAAAKTITLEEAKSIAYAHAGVSESQARDRSTETDDGIYEIDFDYDGWEYEYDIAADGTILKSHREPEAPAQTQPRESRPSETQPRETQPKETQPQETKPAEAKTITLEEARTIAYAHAGVSESQARDRSSETDDGIYEIDFDYDGWEYEYDISREGEILNVRKEPDDDRRTSAPAETQPKKTESKSDKGESKSGETGSKASGSSEKSADRISAEKALSIALDHAGVTDARDKDVEWDDGRWEVSFESGRTEYEYHISAGGSILRWEKETDD